MWLLDKVRDSCSSAVSWPRIGPAASRISSSGRDQILLLEAAYGDTDYLWRENRTIVKGLEREFGLGKREILELLGRANEIRPPVVKLADVTDVIRDRFTLEQRKEVLRLVWRVVEADGTVDEWEESFADHIGKAVGLRGEDARAARGPRKPR